MIYVRTSDDRPAEYRQADAWDVDEAGRLHIRSGSKDVAVYNVGAWALVTKAGDE
jgi:hypothetical protein